jgi:predicted phosphohydrolase
MAVTLVGTPSLATATAGSVTGTFGTGMNAVAGNLLVAAVTAEATTSAAAMANTGGTWTKYAESASNAYTKTAFFWKIRGSSAESAPVFTSSMSGSYLGMQCVIYEFSGANTTTPFATYGTNYGTTANPLTVTTAGNVPTTGCYGLSCHAIYTGSNSSDAWTKDTNWTNRANTGGTTARYHGAHDYIVSPSSGATLACGGTWASVTSSQQAASSVVIQQNPNASVTPTAVASITAIALPTGLPIVPITLDNSAEGITPTGTVLTQAVGGNTGGASGDYFDIVSKTSDGTLESSSLYAAHGTYSIKNATGTTVSPTYYSWTTQMGTQHKVWFRLYLYYPATPTIQHRVWAAVSGATLCGAVYVNATGHLWFGNTAGGAIFTFSGAIPAGQWIRVEGFLAGDASVGQVWLAQYNSKDSTTPDEQNTSAASANTFGDPSLFRYGVSNSVASVPAFYMDDLGLSNAGPLGPALSPDASVTATCVNATTALPMAVAGGAASVSATAVAATTAIPAPTVTVPAMVKIAVVSDMQPGAGWNVPPSTVATRVLAWNPAHILVAGDLANDGTTAQYGYFDTGYGSAKSVTHPAPGNHDYTVTDAANYRTYWGDSACGGTNNYAYAFDVAVGTATWRIYSLNTNYDAAGSIGLTDAEQTAQLSWLTTDLAANTGKSIIAIWHHPRFNQGTAGDNTHDASPLWNALRDANADIVFSGHTHSYQRFPKYSKTGTADAGGIRQFVVGTGGSGLMDLTISRVEASSPASGSTENQSTSLWFGYLRLYLTPTGYSWQFVSQDGTTIQDSGGEVATNYTPNVQVTASAVLATTAIPVPRFSALAAPVTVSAAVTVPGASISTLVKPATVSLITRMRPPALLSAAGKVTPFWIHTDSGAISDATIALEAPRRAAVVLNAWDTGYITKFKAANPKIKCFVYKCLSSARTGDPGSGGEYSAGIGHNYAWVSANHPEWLLTTSGVPYAWSGFPASYACDPGVSSYQQEWLTQVLTDLQAHGWDGVWMDNALVKRTAYGGNPDQYATDAAFQAAYVSMLSVVGPPITAAGFECVANMAGARIYPGVWNSYETYLTGGFDEVWVLTDSPGGELSEYGTPSVGLVAQLQEIVNGSSGAKITLVRAQSTSTDTQGFRYAFASFLLVADGKATFTETSPSGYLDPPPYRTEYGWDFGSPSGAYSTIATKVYRRDFSAGVAVVNGNSTGTAAHIDLGGTYLDQDGNAVTSVDLSPLNGMALRFTTTQNATATPSAISAAATIPFPGLAVALTAAATAGTTAVPVPVVTAVKIISVPGTTAIPAAAVSTGSLLAPAAIGATSAIPAVSLSAAVIAIAVAAACTIPKPAIPAGPGSIAATTAIPAPAISAALTATAVPSTTAIPQPSTRASSSAAPPCVSATVTVPAASIVAASVLAPAALSATTGIAGTRPVAGPAAVAVAASVPGPGLVSGVTLSPAALSCTTAVPLPPSIQAGGNASVNATAVSAAASIPAPAPAAGASLTATSVAATASLTAPVIGPQGLGTPLNADPDFTGGSGWLGWNGVFSYAVPPAGDPYSQCGQIIANGGAAPSIEATAYPLASPGSVYPVAALVYYPNGGNVSVGVDWRTAAGVYVTTATNTVAVPAGQWTWIYTAVTCPAGLNVGRAMPRVGIGGTPASGVYLYAGFLGIYGSTTSIVPAVTVVATTAVPFAVLIAPAATGCTTAVPQPGMATGSTLAPNSLAISSQIPAIVPSVGSTLATAAVAAQTTFSLPAVSGQTSVQITAVAVAASASFTAPAPSAGSVKTATAIAAAATLPAPQLRPGPGPVVATVSIPAPGVSAAANVSVNAAAIVAATTLPAPQKQTGATVSPAPCIGAATLYAPGVIRGTGVSPAAVSTQATITAPMVLTGQSAILTPACITATVTIPLPAAHWPGSVLVLEGDEPSADVQGDTGPAASVSGASNSGIRVARGGQSGLRVIQKNEGTPHAD